METHFPDIEEAHSRLARERVMADLKALANDSEALLRATADDASEKAKEARAKLKNAVEKARKTYNDVQAQGLESAKEAARRTDEVIRAHPYESIAVGFGFGLLLGALLKRD